MILTQDNETKNYYQYENEEVVKDFDSDATEGLSSADKIFEPVEGTVPNFELSKWQDKVEELSSKGQRMVAVGVKTLD